MKRIRSATRLALALATVALVAGSPAPALAHVGSQPIPDAAFYRTELVSITPSPPGVTAKVDPAGEWIELTNTAPAEVIVLGYAREPYLRLTADTVQENQLSQTTYINTALFADALPTSQDNGSVAPSWHQIGSTGTARWHDHRIHWMGQARPPGVAADPRHEHLIGAWTVHALAGGVPFEIRGDLRWLGKPDSAGGQPIPEWLLMLIEGVVVACAVLGFVAVRQRKRRAGGGRPRGRWSAIIPEHELLDESTEADQKVDATRAH